MTVENPKYQLGTPVVVNQHGRCVDSILISRINGIYWTTAQGWLYSLESGVGLWKEGECLPESSLLGAVRTFKDRLEA